MCMKKYLRLGHGPQKAQKWGHRENKSVLECLLSMYEVLSLIVTSSKKKKTQKINVEN